MKKKVFLTRTLHDFALKELRKKYQIEIHSGKIPIPQSKLRSKIKEIDGLICFPYDIINREMIEEGKNLKVISTYSVGFDHIDTEYAKKKKIRVGYTPEVLTDATADMAFSLLLDIARRVTEGDKIIREGRWKEIYGAFDYVGVDLQGKTVGILGLGRIGSTLAKRVKAFDMKITYHNRKPVTKSKERTLDAKYVSFEKLIRESDFISIHVPHTKETDGLFNMKIFKKMKKTSFLINTSRGKVVNEKDLVIALKKKIISGAGLDVFDKEPISKDHPLVKLPNIVLAPHIGSSTKETRIKMAEITVKNLNLGINGKKPIYSVGY
ncbi:MAG: D-glycerate dehydrogenase [Nitrosopumilus sp.]|nr:D-glycerate dehydrogenase [Nitrosopumilus sp.]MDF2423349.1 D-glycerate dehydrogenase [Nitrosopumilus sp.]MDF2425505.1 D-glycerate dehydrogenase [Nitrosopumilus sp.]MDF2426725.1 D-glycerate dehydrogenase [Nitrosopumilus sp.]MDF2428124.1 D-glycerate dehydrogenase [Nitrosopumilus sp.]